METTDKLRDWARHVKDNPHLGELTDLGVRGLDAIAHGIEREVAERYVELPVDMDGVPIRVGETCYDKRTGEPFEVSSVEWNGVCWSAWSKPEQRHIYDTITHVKPRTVEGAVRDFVNSVVTFKGSRDGIPIVGIDDSLWRDYFDAFADEIRELMGVDA